MPVQLEIVEDGYVLHYIISDPWDLPELFKAYDQELAYRDSVPHVVHSITDFSGARRMPHNWWSARQGPGLTHPRGGDMVFFGLAMGLNVLVDTILKATHYHRVKVFQKPEDAWAYVRTLAAQSKSESNSATGN